LAPLARLLGDTAYREPVVLVVGVVFRIHVVAVEVQVVGVVAIVRRTAPIVPVVAAIVCTGTVPVAGIHEPEAHNQLQSNDTTSPRTGKSRHNIA